MLGVSLGPFVVKEIAYALADGRSALSDYDRALPIGASLLGRLCGTVYGSYWLFIHDHWAWWVALIFGTVLTRVLFEFALLAFRSYDRLVEVRDALRTKLP